MKIEIDLSELGFTYDAEGNPEGATSLEQAIVAEAARALLAGDMGRTVRTQIEETVTEEARVRAKALIEQAFTEPIQPTTRWGEKQGEPTTVRELVRLSIEHWMTVAPGDRYNGNNNGVYRSMRDLIEAEVKSVMTKELQAEVARVKKTVAETIQKHALAAAVAAITPK